MDNNERQILEKMVKESDFVDNTHIIRNMKNSDLIKNDVNKLLKLMLSILYIVEFKVLVNVRMDNLNDFSKPILSTTRKLDKIKRLTKKEMNIKKDILTFSSDIFLFELKIVLLIILFGLINFNISDDVILRRI